MHPQYANDPTPISPVNCAINSLGATLSHCAGLIEKLEAKIGPTLVQSVPLLNVGVGSETNTLRPATCTLVDQIDEARTRVEVMSNRVHRLLDECQL